MKGYWLLTRSKTSLTALDEICEDLGGAVAFGRRQRKWQPGSGGSGQCF
jgi:hypothetical protein